MRYSPASTFAGLSVYVVAFMITLSVGECEEEDRIRHLPKGWQERIQLGGKGECLCSIGGELPKGGILFARPPETKEVEAIVSNIIDFAGLAPNFRVVEIDRDNAVAVVRGGERILGFGKSFLQGLGEGSGTDWARLGVMAHEIGHHLQGHTDSGISQLEAHTRELQADEYAGFICGMMGASKEDASAFVRQLGFFATDTHPARKDRIAAAEQGWNRALHIRRTVEPNRTCPLIRLEGEGFERRKYTGKLGKEHVEIEFAKSPDETVYGTYELNSKGEARFHRFVGRADRSGDVVNLEEFFGCQPSARIVLARECTVEVERWSGNLFRENGKRIPVTVTRKLPDSLHLGGSFEPKGVKSSTLAITTLAGFPGRWFPVLSSGTGISRQVVYQGAVFPSDWIEEKSSLGMKITSISGDSVGWVVVMSQDSGFGDQKVIGPAQLDRERLATLHQEGYRTTSLGGFIDQWAVVLSKNSGLGEQEISEVGDFDEDWIERKLKGGYRVTEVAGDSSNQGESWLIVVSRNSPWSDQVVSDGNGFPIPWIREKAEEGYRITSASGYHGWRIVMSKETAFLNQVTRQPALHFPIEFLEDKLNECLEEYQN